MTVTENTTELKAGRVVAIAGPVVDVEFPRGSMPEINHALEMTLEVAVMPFGHIEYRVDTKPPRRVRRPIRSSKR